MLGQAEAQVLLRGTVSDTSGMPLVGATINIVNSVQATASDLDGRYQLHLPVGEVRLVVRYLGYESLDTVVAGAYHDTLEVEVRLRAQALDVSEVVVYARLARGQAEALEVQRTGPRVQSVVHSDLFNRYPDVTLVETVQRLPGVSITRDRGEGEFVQIRGLPELYNAISLNGQRLPAVQPEADRAVPLDLIQSNLIEEVRVIKSLTPDMDADAIGGTVDFRLKQPTDRTEAVFQAGYGLNSQASELMELPRRIVQGAAYLNRNLSEDRIKFLVAGNYFQTGRGSIRKRFLPDQLAVADFDNDRRRYGLIGSLEYQPSIYHRLKLGYTISGYIDEEIQRQALYNFGQERELRLTANQRDERTVSLTVLEVESSFGRVGLEYGLSFADSKQELPDRLRFEYSRANAYDGIAPTQRADLGATSTFGLPDLTLQSVQLDALRTEETIFNGNFNLDFPINRRETSRLKTGVRYRGSERLFGGDQQVALPTSPQPLAGGTFGFAGVRLGDSELATLPLDRTLMPDLFNSPFAYEAREDIIAGFLMNTTNWTGRLTTIAGVRYEYTDYDYRQLTTEDAAANDYDNWLPSLNAIYRITPTRQLRFAYYEGLNRPPYATLVPFEFSQTQNGLVTGGNAEVRPVVGRNLDLVYEHYGSNENSFTIGLYAKFLEDPYLSTVETDSADSSGLRRVFTFQNADRARVVGGEIALYQNLGTYIPSLANLDVNANYSYNFSDLEGIQAFDEDLPLFRSPRHIANLSLVYTGRQGDLSVVVAGVFRDFVLDRLQDGQAVYLDRSVFLDLAVDYQLTDRFSAYFRLNNITNQTTQEYINRPTASDAQLLEEERFGTWGAVGMRLRSRR